MAGAATPSSYSAGHRPRPRRSSVAAPAQHPKKKPSPLGRGRSCPNRCRASSSGGARRGRWDPGQGAWLGAARRIPWPRGDPVSPSRRDLEDVPLCASLPGAPVQAARQGLAARVTKPWHCCPARPGKLLPPLPSPARGHPCALGWVPSPRGLRAPGRASWRLRAASHIAHPGVCAPHRPPAPQPWRGNGHKVPAAGAKTLTRSS